MINFLSLGIGSVKSNLNPRTISSTTMGISPIPLSVSKYSFFVRCFRTAHSQ